MWRPPNSSKHAIPETAWPTALDAQRSALFSPLSVGRLQLNQRTWVPAMVPWRATETGEVTDSVVDWYARFARGRPGAIVVEATGVRDIPSGPLLRIGHDRYVPGLKRIVDAVKDASDGETQLFIQLIDFLALKRRPKPQTYFERFLRIGEHHRKRLSDALGDLCWLEATDDAVRACLIEQPDHVLEQCLTKRELSDLRFGYRERIDDLQHEHIRTLPHVLPQKFADAAARAQAAGFHGVELHYAHAYTMASFLSPTNQRTDGYGGRLDERLRCPTEVYQAVRKRVGDGFAVGCRFLVDEVIEGGFDADESVQIGQHFAQLGMDFLSLSKGGKFDDAKQPHIGQAVYPYTGRSGYECMPTVYSDSQGPFYRNIEAMAQVKSAILAAGFDTPVIVAGGINDFQKSEALLQAGQADVIASARQSLADPDWFLKMKTGQGRTIRRCKYTNYCEALDTRHKEVTCQLWDRVNIREPGVKCSHDGKRRLTAPDWPTPLF